MSEDSRDTGETSGTFYMQMIFWRMRSANPWRMFSESMATTNLYMHNNFRRMYGEHSANVWRLTQRLFGECSQIIR